MRKIIVKKNYESINYIFLQYNYALMKKLYLLAISLLLTSSSFSQLYVKPINSGGGDEAYVYNKGTILFVKQDINLDGGSPDQIEGNIYLRDEGQLMQGVTKDFDNAGTGIVSVYQVGTTNAYDYQFWASPVNDPSSGGTLSDGNRPFNLNEVSSGGGLYDAKDNTLSNLANFITDYNGYTTSDASVGVSNLFISNSWLYKFVNGNSYNDWSYIGHTVNLEPGEGFSMKGLDNDQTPYTYDFRGRPNNGDIEVAIEGDNQSLVGNPYPSAIDLNYFILANSGASFGTLNCGGTETKSSQDVITGEAYFWESDSSVESHYLAEYQGGYGTYTPDGDCDINSGTYVAATFSMYDGEGNDLSQNVGGGDNTIERRYSPIGQGFFVVGDNAPVGSKVIFKNAYRSFVKESSSYSDFKKLESVTSKNGKRDKISPDRTVHDEETGLAVTPKFRMLTGINNTYVRENAVVFKDIATAGFDKAGDAHQISELPTDINFVIPSEELPIVTFFDQWSIDNEIPLKINANSNSNTYSIKVSSINFNTEGIWIYDANSGEYHDILNATYDLSLPKGDYTGRFKVVFQNKESLAIEDAEEVRNSFAVFQNNKQAQLTILNPNRETLSEIIVFDISGKLITSKINENDNERVFVSTSNWSDGVYIVQVKTAQNIEVSKKVSVLNKN